MSIALVAGLALIGSPATAAPTPTPSGGGKSTAPQVTPQGRAIDLVQPSVVMIQSEWEAFVDFGGSEPLHRTWSSRCTGTIVSSDGYVATAGHCADPKEARRDVVGQVVAELIDEGYLAEAPIEDYVNEAMSGRDRWLVFGKDRDSPPYSEHQVQLGGGVVKLPEKKDSKDGVNAKVIEIVPFDDGDVALLKIDEKDLPVAQLATEKAQIGQDLVSIGYPLANVSGDEASPSFKNGEINAVNTVGVHGPGNDFYESSATLIPGNSGGAQINFDGQVIGIASNTIDSSNFIVPASVVAEVLKAHQVKNELGRVDTLYRTGLGDLYRGYYSDAIKSFEQVAAISPTHRLAKDKIRDAADLRQRFGDQVRPAPPKLSSRSPLLVWGAVAAGVVLLLVLVFGAIWFVRRRRASAPVSDPPHVLVGLPASPYGPGGMDDDTHVGYGGPLYRSGPYPPAYANEPPVSTPPVYGPPAVGPHGTPWSAPPFSAAPFSATPASATPASATPASATPWSTPPASTPPASTPPWNSPAVSEPVAGKAPASWASLDGNPPVPAPESPAVPDAGHADFVGRAEVQDTPSPFIPRQPQAGGFCPQCGAPRGAGDGFCSSCGARLGAPTVRPS
jgi:S1-C subfamily serine protease